MPTEPDIPTAYNAAVFESKDSQLSIKEIPLEYPERGEVLIKVLACGVCYSDVEVQKGSFGNDFPIVPGHEIVGDVVALAPGEPEFRVGDRVGGPWHGGHDRTCRQCNHGNFQLCPNRAINGVTRAGGYAQYCLLRTEATVRVPTDIEPAQAAPILCAGVTTFNSIRKMNVPPPAVVAIQGVGGLGHLAIQYASKMGYDTVAISGSSSKEKLSRELGAHHFINSREQDVGAELQKLGGASLIVFSSPNNDLVTPLMQGLAPLGKLLVLGVAGDITVSTPLMITNGLSVCAWPSGHAVDSEDALAFGKTNDISCMIEKYKLEDAQKAIDNMVAGKTRFRGVIVME
ncbi:hypothetical protein FQN54_006605 [Arachnomyces sp. PD_36]|nr:hypothetical protein FQN54_006605 [Arachnomyces sp. PD_36]